VKRREVSAGSPAASDAEAGGKSDRGGATTPQRTRPRAGSSGSLRNQLDNGFEPICKSLPRLMQMLVAYYSARSTLSANPDQGHSHPLAPRGS